MCHVAIHLHKFVWKLIQLDTFLLNLNEKGLDREKNEASSRIQKIAFLGNILVCICGGV